MLSPQLNLSTLVRDSTSIKIDDELDNDNSTVTAAATTVPQQQWQDQRQLIGAYIIV